MKCIYVFLSLCAIVNCGMPPDVVQMVKQKIMEMGKECKTEISATDDDIAPLLKHELPTTQVGKCFVACMDKKFGFLDKGGMIDKAETMSMIDKMKGLDEDMYGKMKKIADVCLAEVTNAANECETAYNLLACCHREKKIVGLQPIDFE